MSPMNNRRMVPTQEPGILDFAPGAAAAYSLRNLSLSYSGPVVTVRRSTDDAEADFTASEVSDGTLAAWCSGGDGFVKTWHDQSGEGNDASQGTAASQPQIVDSGVTASDEEKPAVSFDGSMFLSLPSIPGISGTNERSFFFVAEAGDATERTVILSDSTNSGRRLEIGLSGTLLQFRFFASAQSVGPIVSEETNLIGYIIRPPANNINLSSAYIFGVQKPLTNDFAIDTVDNYTIGKGSGGASQNFLGTMSELLFYPADQTALRTRIEGNIAWTYSL